MSTQDRGEVTTTPTSAVCIRPASDDCVDAIDSTNRTDQQIHQQGDEGALKTKVAKLKQARKLQEALLG